MSFTPDLPRAAQRHLLAAEALNPSDRQGHRRDVAGYLYGIAAECAIKQMTLPIGFPSTINKNAILYAHFPELRTLLRDGLAGRNAQPIASFINNDAFMNNWHVQMRYADARQIQDGWIDTWAKQARQVVNAMES